MAYQIGYYLGLAIRYWWITLPVILIVAFVIYKMKKGAKNDN